MNKHYYLAASLPYLKFGSPSPISKENFLEECRKWLSDGEMEALLSSGEFEKKTDGEDLEAVRKWKDLKYELRRVLADLRKGTHPAEKGLHLRVHEFLGEKDPLAREKAIEKLRWDVISLEEYRYMFDVNWLAIYYIKMLILERLGLFDHDRGKKFFQEFCGVNDEKFAG